MKKVIFISALAIAAAVSCTKSDIVDTKFNEAISFETYTGRDAMTKAAVTNKTNIVDQQIGLYGYYTGAKKWAADGIANPTANLWDGDALAYDETKGWYTEETKYWTNASDYYSFLAYAPIASETNGVSASADTDANDISVTYTMPVATVTAGDATKNILTTNVDLLYAQVDNTTKGDGAVTLNFKHALSRVTVKAAASDPKEMGIKFDVKNITLSGTYNTTGTLNLATAKAATTESATDAGWSVVAETGKTLADYVFYNDPKGATITNGQATDALESVDYAFYAKNNEGVSVEGTTATNYLMMIPTNFSGTLSVTYTTIYEGQESNPMTKQLPVAINFMMGKAYAIELGFEPVLDEISFNVTVEEWQPTSGEGDNIATDEIEKEAGNPEDANDGWN